jgi:hypothetical protein
MDFAERIRELTVRIPVQREHIRTEEACKNAFVMPFINALGYNVFDPREVTPELVADVGVKKGEKVDYAILKDGKPIILFECKGCDCNLDSMHASQLYRYFSVTDARFGILTNGIVYRFFSDLDAANKMDSKPFLEVNLLAMDDTILLELAKFSKSAFNVEIWRRWPISGASPCVISRATARSFSTTTTDDRSAAFTSTRRSASTLVSSTRTEPRRGFLWRKSQTSTSTLVT